MTGSGYKAGVKTVLGSQGGSTFVDGKYKSRIKQNDEIPEKNTLTTPYIRMKLL